MRVTSCNTLEGDPQADKDRTWDAGHSMEAVAAEASGVCDHSGGSAVPRAGDIGAGFGLLPCGPRTQASQDQGRTDRADHQGVSI